VHIFHNKLNFGACLAGFLLMCGAQVQAGGVSNNKITSLLGGEMVRVLMTPDRVEAFEVAPTASSSGQALSEFEITKKLGQVSPDISSEISALALDDKSHVFEIQKKCRFRPEMGYRFYQASQSVNVLLSTHCKQWLFDSGEVKVYEDFDPVGDKIIGLMQRTRMQAN
jgi:hypothetical protein